MIPGDPDGMRPLHGRCIASKLCDADGKLNGAKQQLCPTGPNSTAPAPWPTPNLGDGPGSRQTGLSTRPATRRIVWGITLFS